MLFFVLKKAPLMGSGISGRLSMKKACPGGSYSDSSLLRFTKNKKKSIDTTKKLNI